MKLINDFVSLLYPNACLTCGNSLYAGERIICTLCRYKLPVTNFHLLQDNPVSKSFWGRVQIESAASYLYFRKTGLTQKLIHHIKYRARKEVGVYLGELFGHELSSSQLFEGVELIIPVPLHKRKLKKRGFNQSELIAIGISKTFKKELDTNHLFRRTHSTTQTRKSRWERWQNVENIFGTNNPKALENKHILLVDDVITTGSTLEACVYTLLQIQGVKVSIGTIAYAV